MSKSGGPKSGGLTSGRRRARDTRPVPPESSRADALERLPAWAAPALYALVTVVLFRDFVFSSRMLYGSDTLGLGYMAREFFAEALRTTGFPLWNPLILGGTPFIESLAGGDSLYPPSLLLLLLTETYRALGWKLVLHVFLAGWFMNAWLRALGVSRAASLLGGLAYLLTPSLVTLVFPGHDGKIFVTALTPLLFWSVESVFRRGGLLPLVGTGGTVALVVLTTHFQLGYFLCGAAGAYAAFRAIQMGRGTGAWSAPLNRFGLFLLFSLVGAGAAGVQLIPAVAYVTEYSRRTHTTVAAEESERLAYSASFSLHPEEAVSLVVPEFIGNGSGGTDWTSGTYWGRNGLKLNHEYLGVVVLLLAALSFLGARERAIRWFLVALGGTAFLFAMGAHTPVWRIAYELLPGISLFRAPSTAIFLVAFSVCTLAALGVERGLEATRGDAGPAFPGERRGLVTVSGTSWPGVRVLAVLVGVLLAGAALAWSGGLTSLWTAVFPIADPGRTAALERLAPFIVRGFSIVLLLGVATLGAWWARSQGYLNGAALVAILALLVTVDEFRVGAPFIQTLDPEALTEPDPAQQFLVERAAAEPPFRVLSTFSRAQDVLPGIHGLELAAGHHPNDMGRYRELIGMEGSSEPMNLYVNPNIARLLNVRYLLVQGDPGPEAGEPLMQAVQANGAVFASVYPNPGLPRARLVGEAIVVPEERVLSVILGEDSTVTGGRPYDPARETVLTEAPSMALAGGPVEGEVVWIERSPNRLVLDVETSGPALLVVADNWFPAWQASLDGAPTPVLRADHTLRGIEVPAGRHRVEMWYESRLLERSFALSVACSGLLLLALGAGLRAGPWAALRARPGGRGSAGKAAPGRAPAVGASPPESGAS